MDAVPCKKNFSSPLTGNSAWRLQRATGFASGVQEVRVLNICFQLWPPMPQGDSGSLMRTTSRMTFWNFGRMLWRPTLRPVYLLWYPRSINCELNLNLVSSFDIFQIGVHHISRHRLRSQLSLRNGWQLEKIGVCYSHNFFLVGGEYHDFLSPLRLRVESTRTHTDREVSRKKMGTSSWESAWIMYPKIIKS